MPEKAESGLDDYDRSARKVRDFKRTYNTMLEKINHDALKDTGYDNKSIDTYISESELDSVEDLKLKIGVHLNKLIGKSGAKHDDKRNILIIALQVLNDQASPSELEVAKTTHSQYNKTSSRSETQNLVDRVLEIKKSVTPVSRF